MFISKCQSKRFIRFVFSSLLLIALSLLPVNVFATTYTVRTIYFIPNDKVASPNNFGKLMKDTQQFYREEMIKHGFGDKTFKLETDDKSNIVIHQINGKHAASHYAANTVDNVFAELPIDLRLKFNFNVNVIILAGMSKFSSGSIAFGGPFTHGDEANERYGGIACICEKLVSRPIEGVIKHELGHTFGLWHNFILDGKSYAMGPGKELGVGIGDDVLHKYEARWLSKSHYFNEHHIFNPAPIVIVRPLKAVSPNIIQIILDIEDSDGLHQIQFVRGSALRSEVFLWEFLDGNKITLRLDVGRDLLAQDDFFRIWVKDDFGNYRSYPHNYVLPDPFEDTIEKPVTNKNPDLDTDKRKENIDATKEEPIEDVNPKRIKPKNRVITSWAKLKI